MTTADSFDAAAWRAFEHAGWQTAAAGYDAWLGGIASQAIGALLDAAGVGPGTRVLDVATGPGYAAAAAAKRGAQAMGIDFATAMVAEATRRFPEVAFGEGDAEALPFPDASFAAVVCNFGILHFAQPDQALREAHRVLVPGGRLAWTTWDVVGMGEAGGVVRRAVQQYGDSTLALPAGPPMDRFSKPDECQRTLEAVGFTAVVVTILPLVQELTDPDGYFDTVLMGAGPRQGSPLRAQSAQAQAAIRQAVRDNLRAYERDGVVRLPSPVVLASATKP
jgi:ubiquinone/menaquinone biosynthesis C-methylase UbiE